MVVVGDGCDGDLCDASCLASEGRLVVLVVLAAPRWEQHGGSASAADASVWPPEGRVEEKEESLRARPALVLPFSKWRAKRRKKKKDKKEA